MEEKKETSTKSNFKDDVWNEKFKATVRKYFDI